MVFEIESRLIKESIHYKATTYRMHELCNHTLDRLLRRHQDGRKYGSSILAQEVVADYLRFLWTYTTDDIRRRQGDDYLSIYSLRIILTVPAIWSDAAKDKTLQAARLAGLPSDIILVTEPEAAALATLREKEDNNNLKVSH